MTSVLVVVLVAGCGGAAAPVPEPGVAERPEVPRPPVPLDVSGQRSTAHVVASGGPSAPYNYGPTVIREGQRYRAWWCGQLPDVPPKGDDLLHAESAALHTVFRTPNGPAVPVFSGRGAGFDGMHTCDPSVIKVNGRYYLYYTGAEGDHAHGNAIGLASSSDGIRWRRETPGRPIVAAAREIRRENVYGAGQPSALFLDGWFYLMFTDTTAAGAGWNGAGQFVLRARDPAFSDRVQALTSGGFQPAGTTEGHRQRSIVDAFSADWMWVDALDAFAIAHQTEVGSTITFWNRTFTHQPYQPVVLVGPWREGPGLVRQPNGHAPVTTSDSCVVGIDVLRATMSDPAPTDIRAFGVDVRAERRCSSGAPGIGSRPSS